MSKMHPDPDADYPDELRALQIELVRAQKHLIKHGQRVLVIFEGRDAAGKDGAIKRIVEHLSPRDTHVVAPGKPSDREESEWYFQRYVPYLPAAGEFVLFNRSWYKRAGVERVVAVGTTMVRSLESAAAGGELKPFDGDTDIFIHPGYRFRVVDALITNFHLPESTLLMLVSAFAGHEAVMQAYRHAVEQKYRFFSYGDAMFVTASPVTRSR